MIAKPQKHKRHQTNPGLIAAGGRLHRLYELPKLLGVSVMTVRRAIDSGRLRATKTSVHCVVVTQDDLAEYLASLNNR